MSSELSRLFERAVLKTVINEGVPAKLGKADGSTLFYVDDAGTHHKDRVWARIGAGTAPAEAVVRCVSVPQTLNLPVIVADRDGVLTVIRTDTNRAVEWADGQLIDVAPHNWTHGRYGSDALYITGLSFLPLAAYPSDPPDLTVTVEQCFYRYQNTHKVFELTTSDSLSAYRPAGTTVTHYVILALDRSTNALAVIDGDDVSGGNRVLPSASTVLATEGLRSEHFPICAIRLYNAQTQIMPRDIFMDLRLWAGESSASGSGSSGSAAVRGPDTSTDHAIARWDGTDGTLLQDSYPTIDDSGNVDLQGNELRDYSHQMIEANTGAAYEIDWSAAGIFELTLTDNPTFTFVNESAGRAVTLILIQDGTGGRTVTWPGAVEWPNDVEPTLFSGVGDADTITLICRNDGSTVSGFAANDVRTNQANVFTVGPQTIQVPTATQVGLILKTTDDDTTENLFEVQGSVGNILGQVTANGALLFEGTGAFTAPAGAGTRMFWHPAKGAFRAGTVAAATWDDGNIGTNSFAVGSSNQASGNDSAALGSASAATNLSSIAIGSGATASGSRAVAIGRLAQATLTDNVAIGSSAAATGSGALAVGKDSSAPNTGSTAIGNTAATGAFAANALAVGTSVTVTASNGVIIGRGFTSTIAALAIGYSAVGIEMISTDIKILLPVVAKTAATVPLTIKAAAAQTANGFEYQNSAGTPLTYIEADGTVTIDLDSIPIQFGAAQDMDIGYDGTDGYLRTDLVAASDLNLDCGAAKTLELQAVVYEDLQVSINNLARGITAPTDRFYDHGVGAGVAYPVLGFAKNDYVWFDVQTHHAMKLNTVLDNHIHFVLPNTTTIGHKFVFQLDVLAAGIDGTWAVPAGSPFTATHTVAANDNTTHRLLEIGDIPSSNTTVSTVYKCKLTRIDGVATEYASEVYLEFSDCHYAKNTMGSRQEGVK